MDVAHSGDVSHLLVDIARCPIVERCHRGEVTRCSTIVGSQTSAAFHLPEPWNGDLAAAPILFLSSNPSIGEAERYPLRDWDDGHIVDFFRNRFREPWTRDALHPLLLTGKDGDPVMFWAGVRARASELLGREAEPGIDYVITETVHCKSPGELGVGDALEVCASRWLRSILEQAAASVIAVLGGHAAEAVRLVLQVDLMPNVVAAVPIGGRNRLLAFLPHPNAHQARTFALYPEHERRRLRAALIPAAMEA